MTKDDPVDTEDPDAIQAENLARFGGSLQKGRPGPGQGETVKYQTCGMWYKAWLKKGKKKSVVCCLSSSQASVRRQASARELLKK